MDKQNVIDTISNKLLGIRQLLIDNDMFKSGYLTLLLSGDTVSFNNEYWDKDAECPINHRFEEARHGR